MASVFSDANDPSPEPVIHNPATVLIGVVVCIAAFQIALLQWQRAHKKSFSIVSLAALWVMPAVYSLRGRFWRFIVIWTVFSVANAAILRRTWMPIIDSHTPRLVYRVYRLAFDVTMGIAAVGYLFFLISAFVYSSESLFGLSFNLMFYGLYFGVLSRDIVEIAVERMSTTIGYYSPEGLPRKNLQSGTCAVCGDAIALTDPFAQIGSDASQTLTARLLEAAASDSTNFVQLNCNHNVHVSCLYGWCLVGKRDMCPYCKEKVDLQIIQTNPWRDPEFVYGKFLDAVRYMVVWMPCVLFIMHFVIEHLRN